MAKRCRVTRIIPRQAWEHSRVEIVPYVIDEMAAAVFAKFDTAKDIKITLTVEEFDVCDEG